MDKKNVKKVNIAKEAIDSIGKAQAGLYLDEDNKAEGLVTTEEVMKSKEFLGLKIFFGLIVVALVVAMVIGFIHGKAM